MNSAQKRAIQNYRTRLGERGLARFEVLGRDSDRELIRSLARRLAEDGPEASRLRATLANEPPQKGGILAALRRSPMADGKTKGRPRSALDTIIAAVAEAHGCIVVTDNEKDFIGIKVVNPLNAGNAASR